MQYIRFLFLGSLLATGITLVNACNSQPHAGADFAALATENNEFRTKRCTPPGSGSKFAINNVRVFNGHELLEPSTVVIDGGVIGTDATGSQQIDGEGGVLLPGLIDTHCHPANITHLQELSRWGVTTGMLMACYSPTVCQSLQNHIGLTDMINGSAPASAPGSLHGNATAKIDPAGNLLVANASQAVSWVESQVVSNPAFIKLVAESPGLDQETLNKLSLESHKLDKTVICHAPSFDAYQQAVTAQADQIHHAPLDKSVDAGLAARMFRQRQVCTPTLTMMKGTADSESLDYTVAQKSVSILHNAGVPILAGTDANNQPGFPAMPPYGSSLHLELELLVGAGLSTAEALRAGTSVAARHWGLNDRGVIAPGLRADLVLIEGNPIENITATRNIKRVWLNGVEYSGPLTDVVA